jgi:hypothetical protein
VAAIAAVFWPKRLVAMSDVNSARLAATTGGGTVIAYADSYTFRTTLAHYSVASETTDLRAVPCQ